MFIRSGVPSMMAKMANVEGTKSKSGDTENQLGKISMNVVTMGHVDHGKTTLSSALTKACGKHVSYEDIDKTPQERKSGITICASNFSYSRAGSNRLYQHTDCPGHKDYVKNTVTGSSSADVAILVVSAVDGVMPQTREHLNLINCMGGNKKRNIVVFLNKIDQADEETIAINEFDIRDLLHEKCGIEHDDAIIIKGSALCSLEDTNDEIGRQSVEKLLDTLDALPDPERDLTSPFVLYVQGVNQVGRGVVVTGSPLQGSLKVGQEVAILGLGASKKTVCISIEMYYKSVIAAESGKNVALLLRGIKKNDVERGQAICIPGTFKTYTKFKARIYFHTEEEGGRKKAIRPGACFSFFIQTATVTGSIFINPEEVILPGDDKSGLEITLTKELVLIPGIGIAIRESNDTIAQGIIEEIIEE